MNTSFKVGDHVVAYVEDNHSFFTIHIGDKMIISHVTDSHISDTGAIYYYKGFYKLDPVWLRKQKLKKLQEYGKDKECI